MVHDSVDLHHSTARSFHSADGLNHRPALRDHIVHDGCAISLLEVAFDLVPISVLIGGRICS